MTRRKVFLKTKARVRGEEAIRYIRHRRAAERAETPQVRDFHEQLATNAQRRAEQV